jgi:hypothetical protein
MKLEFSEDDEVIINHFDIIGEEVTECHYLVWAANYPNIKYGTNDIYIDETNATVDYITMRNTGLTMREVQDRNLIDKPTLIVEDLDTGLAADYLYRVFN